MDQMEGLKAYNCSFERQLKLGKLNWHGKNVDKAAVEFEAWFLDQESDALRNVV